MTFSLRELQELEQERILREKREAQEREEAAARAREEAARREAEARAASERAQTEAREAERRREAMQKALVEQARIEVEARTRAEEAERERRHERELALLRATQDKQGPSGFVASAIGGAVVALLAAGLVYVAAVKPAADRRIAAITDEATRESARAVELERKVDGLQASLDAASRELDELRKRPTQAAPPPKPPSSTGSGPVVRTPRTPQVPAPAPTVCLKGDPLCPTITPGR